MANSAHILEQASGDLLKFLYDDDLLRPACLETMARLIEARDYSYAFCRCQTVDEDAMCFLQSTTCRGDSPLEFDNTTVVQSAIKRMENPLGEPTCLLIRRSAFGGSACLSSYGGLPIRHMIDVAFSLNAACRGKCIGIAHALAAFRVHPRHVSAQKRARAFSAGVFEWEIFLRGAVENGLIQPDDALGPLAALQAAYRNFHQAFAEIEGLQRGLPALHSALARGDTRVLTDAFRSEIRAAHRTIDDRKRRSR